MIKGIASTMPEGLLSTTASTTISKVTSTTKSLDGDIDHFTTRDRTTTDVYVGIPESKLNTILSAISFALVLILAVTIFACMVYFYAQIKKAKGSKSAKIELTKIGELTTKPMNPPSTFNTYASPIHSCYCSEEKVDIM